ncbi:VCBS repeat-containing protein [Crocinitomix catalasitica]|nr:VCBS repeat-containing protein [Crocinitomix catalasitica]
MTKYLLIGSAILTASCGNNTDIENETEETAEEMFFEAVPAKHSRITFKNTIAESDRFNYMNFQYIYNGGGVAVGDLNNDGLCDIYFTGNQVQDRLYLNKGDMVFEDITDDAIGNDISMKGWHTGVTMADVNQDGLLDIFISRSGLDTDGEKLRNFLFINLGDMKFGESGIQYGLTSERATNQSAFFDMDNDGDLDLYCMNKPYDKGEVNIEVDLDTFPYSDQLFENRDGYFVEISKEAGIQNEGYGLGLAISDLNGDGYQDIYISNDYITPDFMYINQGDGTFVDEVNDRTNHTSQYAMGNDIADFNNDGLVDIMVADMVSEDHIRSKKNMGAMNPDDFWGQVKRGNQMEYMFNTLQLNNGNGTFSDVGQMAGISKTDWSWATLFADFDNDGLKDLLITNGYRRDVRDNDFIKQFNREKKLAKTIDQIDNLLDLAPATKLKNYVFKNLGDLQFKKVTQDWKLDQDVNSNGAAYADLDNDGDLDLVINNMEETSVIYENKLKSTNHYLKVKCDKNFDGAKVTIVTNGQTLYQEMHPTRGFQSSVEHILHFGLGKIDLIQELKVVFYDSKVLTLSNVKVDELLTINYSDAKKVKQTVTKNSTYFTEEDLIDFIHEEFVVDDFEREILLPHKMSQLGPFLSKGDVNGDKRDDFYISGSIFSSGALYVQNTAGKFDLRKGPWKLQRNREELGSLFFDADGDGDMDLYVISGSNEYKFDHPALMDQLYINDGTGNFKNETSVRLPRMPMSGQRLTAADYDQDGDLDLFVGGRQVPGYYPYAPRSYLLENNDGVFTDVTTRSPDLMRPGLITQSLFDDFDGDGDLDLICVGEWMPITFFENNNGSYSNVTEKFGLDKDVGWWMSITKGDFNGDGKNDYVVGNIGENNKFHPTTDHPLEIFVDDFDQNGTYDIVLGEYQNGKCYPVRGRQCSSEQMPFIKQKFPTFDEFAVADLEGIYGKKELDSALHYSATNFSSCILLSNGSGYSLKRLPSYAQFGPINSQILLDVNNDGNLDVLAVGNNFGVEVETIRYDSGRGVLLLGDGAGGFKQLAPFESGFFVNTDAKDMIRIKNWILIASNSAGIKSFKILTGETPS